MNNDDDDDDHDHDHAGDDDDDHAGDDDDEEDYDDDYEHNGESLVGLNMTLKSPLFWEVVPRVHFDLKQGHTTLITTKV